MISVSVSGIREKVPGNSDIFVSGLVSWSKYQMEWSQKIDGEGSWFEPLAFALHHTVQVACTKKTVQK
jgi:hypothetical protein